MLLQDIPFLIESYPKSRLWNFPIFQSSEFKEWAHSVTQFVNSEPTPEDLVLQNAMPILAKTINRQHDVMREKIDHLQQSFNQVALSIDEIKGCINLKRKERHPFTGFYHTFIVV